ncbi:hypothetical protein [Legionella sp.]|uniref:hypothetical protein n=1 Tax=Legionella sp. TaxID=459 RepID=UPI003C995462
MTKIIKKNDWNRDATFIKFIMELIQKGGSDEDIINLVIQGKQNFAQDVKLSEADIFLLYCKLIEAKRTPIVKHLRLIEELIDFKEEYFYATTYKKDQYDYPMHFPLLAYCVYNQVDWKDIAYIQQHKEIDNAINIQIELKKSNWDNQLVKESLWDNHQELKQYKPYLMMGDVYVDFLKKKDNWDIKIREIYTKYPQQVNAYLEYMAGHFSLAMLATPAGDESETAEVSKNTQDWLIAYAKALRNMTEKVIDLIKAKRSLTKERSHEVLCEVSRNVLSHLNGCDEKILKVLGKKSCEKLMDFIKVLRKNENKVLLVPAYNDTQFFTSASLSSTENKLPSEITQKTNFAIN